MTPGTRLGPYEVLSILGAGGMGEVYRARDTRLNRTVAIKFLAPEMADVVARRRFQQEAQTASSLNHPHILTVFEAGESDGRQYLVTEFIDGGTLQDWAHGEKRTWRQIVELLADTEFPWDVRPIVESHHERWDGGGYPHGLAGEAIPLSARVLCIADVYDALTSKRGYKEALSHDAAMALMRADVGTQFDPTLFAAFEIIVRRGTWRDTPAYGFAAITQR